MHDNVEECGHVPTNESLRWGDLRGLGTMSQNSDTSFELLLREYSCIFWIVPLPRTQSTYLSMLGASTGILHAVVCTSPAANDGSEHRYPAIATGVSILYATNANRILHIYSAVRGDFSRQAGGIFFVWLPVAEHDYVPEPPTTLTNNAVKNHSSQTHAVSDDRGQSG